MKNSRLNFFGLALFTIMTMPIAVYAQSDTARSISMTCGETQVDIVCGYNQKRTENDSRFCSQNTLMFIKTDGSIIKPPIPKEFDPGSFPMDLNCSKGNDGLFYSVIVYRTGVYQCGECHADTIYDSNGQRISPDKPVIRVMNQKHLQGTSFISIDPSFNETHP